MKKGNNIIIIRDYIIRYTKIYKDSFLKTTCSPKPESIVEKTTKCITTAVKKMMTQEEDDEEAAYDRGDDLVSQSKATGSNVEHAKKIRKGLN